MFKVPVGIEGNLMFMFISAMLLCVMVHPVRREDRFTPVDITFYKLIPGFTPME